MKYSEYSEHYDSLIRRGSSELTVLEKKDENRVFRDFLRTVILMQMLRG